MTILLSILLGLLLLWLLWLLLICPTDTPKSLSEPFLGRAIAHRGLHGQMEQAPENSLAAFRLATEHGYGIELDLQLSQDGQVVVFHDDTLKRVCGVDGYVADHSYDALSGFALNGTNERIPLFSEVLSLVAGRVPLIMELKRCKRGTELVEKALALLADYSGVYCIESFDPFLIAKVRRRRPDIFRGQLACYQSRPGKRLLDFAAGNLLFNWVSRPHFIAYRHEDMKNRSYRAATRLLHAVPVAWTVRSQDDYYRLFDSGIDIQIFENFLPPVFLVEGDPNADAAEQTKEPKETA